MAIEDDADRLALLEDDGVTLTKGAFSITVLFNNTYIDVEDVVSSAPNVLGRTSDFTAASMAKDSDVTVNSTNYKVRELHPDGTGYTRLILEQQ